MDGRGVDRNEPRLLTLAQRVLDKQQMPAGVAIGVGLGADEASLGRGLVGVGRHRAPGADTIFEIGSITKVFTATLLTVLAEEGLVTLDEPVNDLLPEGARLPSAGRPVTLQDLATHTSGLPRLPAGLLRRSLRQRQDPYARFTPADLDAAAAGARPRSAPGRTVRYSNFGVALLGHALATRAGLGFATLVEQRICVPLELRDTRAVVPDADLDRFADGHDRRGRPAPHWQMGVMSAAGALRSTVTDLMRFLHAQCSAAAPTEQDATLPPGLTRAIRSTQVPLHRRGRMGQGLGWMILVDGSDSSRRLLVHTGGTGGFRSYCACMPEQNVRVVVLANNARSVDKIGWTLVRAMQQGTA